MSQVRLSKRYSFGIGQSEGQGVDSHSYFNSGVGYGWVNKASRKNGYREQFPIEELRNFILGKGLSTLRVDISPGKYRANLHIGDGKGVLRQTHISFSHAGISMDLGLVKTQREHFGFISFDFDVGSDCEFVEISFDDDSTDDGWAVNSIEIFIRDCEIQPPQRKNYLPELNNWQKAFADENDADNLWKEWSARFGTLEIESTGLSRSNYLDLIEATVDFFVQYQSDEGGIIDPQKEVEFQYSTPCFAYCASLVAVEKNRKDLYRPALEAFIFASKALGNKNAADGHEDFYPAPLASAYKYLIKIYNPQILEEATRYLKVFDPYVTYRKRPGGTKRSGSNWNCKALSGQFMLEALGIQQPTEYTKDSLLRQGKLFNNRYGLYAEGPMTYDAFPRAWLSMLLEWGYSDKGGVELTKALKNANITSLFMQGPNGEMPTGGRSSQHLWADAVQCVNLEWAVKQIKNDNTALAGSFKRAARKSLNGMRRWQRASGELCVVKNYFEPEHRHGFEVYSSHSQYNLLCMTALGFAYELSENTESVSEKVTPSDVGNSGFHIEAGIEKGFANSYGFQVEVALDEVPNQTARGVVRVLKSGLPPQLPLGDTLPRKPLFNLGEENSNLRALALGISWIKNEESEESNISTTIRKESVASLSSQYVKTKVSRSEESADGWFFQLEYEIDKPGLFVRISESIEVTADGVNISWDWNPEFNRKVFLDLPLFFKDGRQESNIIQHNNEVRLSFEGKSVLYKFAQTNNQALVHDEPLPFRMGYFKHAEVEASKNSIAISIKVVK